MGQNKKWQEDELVTLCRAVMDVSTNAATGTDQDAGTFWANVMKNMQALTNNKSARSIQSLTTRWKEVQKHVSLFTGFYSKVRCYAVSKQTRCRKLLKDIANL